MKAPKFTVLETYANRPSAVKDAEKKGLMPDEAVFHCENGMFGYEIRIYDDWKEWQPNLYLGSK
jgi:hypothetical protein